MSVVALIVGVAALAALVTLVYLLSGLRRHQIALSAPCGPTPRTSLADDTHGCVHDGCGTPVVAGAGSLGSLSGDRSRGTFDSLRLLAEVRRTPHVTELPVQDVYCPTCRATVAMGVEWVSDHRRGMATCDVCETFIWVEPAEAVR